MAVGSAMHYEITRSVVRLRAWVISATSRKWSTALAAPPYADKELLGLHNSSEVRHWHIVRFLFLAVNSFLLLPINTRTGLSTKPRTMVPVMVAEAENRRRHLWGYPNNCPPSVNFRLSQWQADSTFAAAAGKLHLGWVFGSVVRNQHAGTVCTP